MQSARHSCHHRDASIRLKKEEARGCHSKKIRTSRLHHLVNRLDVDVLVERVQVGPPRIQELLGDDPKPRTPSQPTGLVHHRLKFACSHPLRVVDLFRVNRHRQRLARARDFRKQNVIHLVLAPRPSHRLIRILGELIRGAVM